MAPSSVGWAVGVVRMDVPFSNASTVADGGPWTLNGTGWDWVEAA